jgi:hypothetical protein
LPWLLSWWIAGNTSAASFPPSDWRFNPPAALYPRAA